MDFPLGIEVESDLDCFSIPFCIDTLSVLDGMLNEKGGTMKKIIEKIKFQLLQARLKRACKKAKSWLDLESILRDAQAVPGLTLAQKLELQAKARFYPPRLRP